MEYGKQKYNRWTIEDIKIITKIEERWALIFIYCIVNNEKMDNKYQCLFRMFILHTKDNTLS